MTAPQPQRRVAIRAPAKLNLGLEVTGRRPDGYHDLVTIYQAIDLADDVTLTATAVGVVRCGLPGVADADNLAVRAAERLRSACGVPLGAGIAIAKQIPIAGGLGGASSDAAAALLGGRLLWDLPLSDAGLRAFATELGSDVPFFLRGGTALAAGRGDRLDPLPRPDGVVFVVVAPTIVIPRKTPTLYAALESTDFSAGERVRAQAERLRSGLRLEPDLLGNAFSRALAATRPELADLPARLRRLGAPNVALSGAGPAHYVVLFDPDEATGLARRLRIALASSAAVHVCRPLAHPVEPRIA